MSFGELTLREVLIFEQARERAIADCITVVRKENDITPDEAADDPYFRGHADAYAEIISRLEALKDRAEK